MPDEALEPVGPLDGPSDLPPEDEVPDWVAAIWAGRAVSPPAGADLDGVEPRHGPDGGTDGLDEDTEPRAPEAMTGACVCGSGPSLDGVDVSCPDVLAGAVPGSGLVAVLSGLDPDVVGDAGVVEVVAAWSRVGSWVHAQVARWAGVLAGRDAMNPAWSIAAGGAPAVASVAGDELAMRLAVSRRQACELVGQGLAFAGPLAATGEALAAGRIDPARARVLVGRLSPLALPVALAVEDRVLPGADHRTVGQVRRDVERALVEVDGAEAVARHARPRTARRVEHPRLLPDGMAALWCVLPAADAARVDGTLDAVARAGRAAGDPRTLDQLRADVLRDLIVHGSTTRHPRTGTRHAAGRVEVHVTVPLSTLLGVDEGPGHIAGLGPVDAVQARALAAGGPWRRIVTDPLTGTVLDVGRTRYRPTAAISAHVQARDARCARPGCDVDAHRADLDHTVEFHAPPHADRRDGPPGPGAPPLTNAQHDPAGDPPRADRHHTPDTTSRAPAAGAPAPGAPAPGAPGTGTTSVTNLGPLCRRDHRLKTDGGYTLTQPEPGLFVWTTPTGQTYRTRPGTDTPYRHRPPIRPAAGPGTAPSSRTDDPPPPF